MVCRCAVVCRCVSRVKSDTEVFEFNGNLYYRSPSKKYFSRSVWDKVLKKRRKELLHRAVWIFYNGSIPKGKEIHHKDRNTGNNLITNLECLSKSEHCKIHAKENSGLGKWVKSEEGRNCISNTVKERWRKAENKKYICERCCGVFTSNHITRKPKYCSSLCAQQARKGIKSKKCKICKEDFIGRGYTCSVKCFTIFWTYKCQECRKEYVRNRKTSRFCSKSCRAKNQHKNGGFGY